MNRWRDACAPIIEDVLARTLAGTPERRKALRDAYPFGERAMWPYKVWLDEIARQTGRKPRYPQGVPVPDAPGQMRLVP